MFLGKDIEKKNLFEMNFYIPFTRKICMHIGILLVLRLIYNKKKFYEIDDYYLTEKFVCILHVLQMIYIAIKTKPNCYIMLFPEADGFECD